LRLKRALNLLLSCGHNVQRRLPSWVPIRHIVARSEIDHADAQAAHNVVHSRGVEKDGRYRSQNAGDVVKKKAIGNRLVDLIARKNRTGTHRHADVAYHFIALNSALANSTE